MKYKQINKRKLQMNIIEAIFNNKNLNAYRFHNFYILYTMFLICSGITIFSFCMSIFVGFLGETLVLLPATIVSGLSLCYLLSFHKFVHEIDYHVVNTLLNVKHSSVYQKYLLNKISEKINLYCKEHHIKPRNYDITLIRHISEFNILEQIQLDNHSDNLKDYADTTELKLLETNPEINAFLHIRKQTHEKLQQVFNYLENVDFKKSKHVSQVSFDLIVAKLQNLKEPFDLSKVEEKYEELNDVKSIIIDIQNQMMSEIDIGLKHKEMLSSKTLKKVQQAKDNQSYNSTFEALECMNSDIEKQVNL